MQALRTGKPDKNHTSDCRLSYFYHEKTFNFGQIPLKVVIRDTVKMSQFIQQLINIRQENAMFKFRLSELVDRSVMSDFLSKAEKFHNELIANDESIALLIDSANHIKKQLSKSDPGIQMQFLEKREQLARDLSAFQGRFSLLKARFESELSGKSNEL